ncbi:MAG: hypothetical protein ICV71_08475, partial [Thermoleophilia bacterium]|nr:hypothetical protein [Thermoleophilia bacterium]
MSAVSRVRSNAEVTQSSISSPASSVASVRACATPRSLKGHRTSIRPFTSPRALKTLSPWRTRIADSIDRGVRSLDVGGDEEVVAR